MEVSLQSFRKRFTYDPQKDLLGKGGFGDVYKAFDNEDQIFVALKIAHASADDKHNLINEIKRFKKLHHPNIIKHIEAYEVNTGGFDIHGRPIINHVGVLEYADKGTLADFLKSKAPSGFQTLTGFKDIIEDLAHDIIDGLAYLHSQNIIHRDLKPTNILLFSDGDKMRAKITDFGIAKHADATAASTQLVGTVEYMAPEYFTTGNITKASDLWSLGVMLLEALSGTHPFGKTTQGLSNEQIIRNILSKDIAADMQNVTAPFKDLITRCLMREAYHRPQSAEELKGLMMSSDDEFSERTQIISTKKKVLATENNKSKWKRLIAALFDFDVRNGKWRKVLAREFLLALGLPILIGILHIAFMIPLYFVTKPIIEKRIESIWSLSEQEFGINSETKSHDGYKFSLYWVYSNLDKRDHISYENLRALFLEDYIDIKYFRNLIDFISYPIGNGYVIPDFIFAFAFLPALLLYPIRFFLLILIWAFSALDFHISKERFYNTVKYSVPILFMLCLTGLSIYLFYSLKSNTELVQSTSYITKTVSAVAILEKFRLKTRVDNSITHVTDNLQDKSKLKPESETAQYKPSSYNKKSKIHTTKSIQSKEKVYFLYCFYQDYTNAVVVNYCTNIVSINVKEPESLYNLGFFAEDYFEKTCNTNFRGFKSRVFKNYQDAINSLRLDFSEAVKLDFCKIEDFRKEAIRKFN